MASEAAKLSAVVGDIYDAAIDPTLWVQALENICAFVGGSSAALLWHDSALARSEAVYVYNVDPHYLRLYFEKYLILNPMFPAAAFIDEGVVVADEDIMPRAELRRTRFYKEWIEPQGTLGALSVNLEKGLARTSMINVRMTVPLQSDMRRRLGLLVPHLQRATAIGKLFDQHAATELALTETLHRVDAAIIMVSSTATVCFANEAARRLLIEAKLVTQVGDKLQAVAPESNRALRDVFRSAQNGDDSVGRHGIAIPLTDGSQHRWLAQVLPLSSGRRLQMADNAAIAAVFIRKTLPNPLSPLEGLAKLYALSASEVRVLDAVQKVTGVNAIAELLGISQATVKTHLHNLFRKTKTKRQSELIKLIAGI